MQTVLWISIAICVVVIGVSAGVTTWAYRVQGREKIDELPSQNNNSLQNNQTHSV